MVAARHRRLRADDHMLAADVHVVHEPAGLHIQAVAGRGVSVSDQNALTAFGNVSVGLDQIAAAAQVRRHLGRQMAHAGMKHVTPARAVEALGVHDEALAKAVVERQHVVLFRLVPPQRDHGGEPLRLCGREIIRLGEVLVEME